MPDEKKTIYVSGATGFIGSYISKFLLAKGYKLLLGGKDPQAMDKLNSELSPNYKNLLIEPVIFDLSDTTKWQSALERIDSHEISGYVNCSGVQGKIKPVSDLEITDYVSVFNINLFSSIFFTKYFLERRRLDNVTSIIHFSGGGATSARPFFAPYSLSKTALVRFIENTAIEYQSRPVKINAIAPGVMPSRMQEEILKNNLLIGSKEHETALKVMETPAKDYSRVLNLVAFLLSDASNGITGKIISAEWDSWERWPEYLSELQSTELYTLRRVTARDRNKGWGDI